MDDRSIVEARAAKLRHSELQRWVEASGARLEELEKRFMDLAPAIPGETLVDKARFAVRALGHATALERSSPTTLPPLLLVRDWLTSCTDVLTRFASFLVRKVRAVEKGKLDLQRVQQELTTAWRDAALAVVEAFRTGPEPAAADDGRDGDGPREFVSGESLHPLLGRLERWLAEHRPDFLAELEPGATDDDLARIEAEAGGPLPPLYKKLLCWRDGGSLDSLYGNFYLMSSSQVADAMEMDADQFDEPLWWHDRWVPFLDNGSSNHLCIDLAGCFGGQPGQIVEFWHEDEDRNVVYPSFEAWLSTLVEGLELGLVEDDGTELDEDLYRRFERSRNPGYPRLGHAHWTPGAPVAVEEVEPIGPEELAARIAELRAPELDVASVVGTLAAPLAPAPAPSPGDLEDAPVGTVYFTRSLPYASGWYAIYVKLAPGMWAKGRAEGSQTDRELSIHGALVDLRTTIADRRQREYRLSAAEVERLLSDAEIYHDGMNLIALEGREARDDPYFCRLRSRLGPP